MLDKSTNRKSEVNQEFLVFKCRGQKLFCIRMLGLHKHFPCRIGFHNLTVAHDHYFMAKAFNDLQVMADKHIGKIIF